MIEESLHPHFSRISDRIIKADFKLKDHQVNIIAAYAPTLTKSEEDPKLREEFYDELEVVTAKHKKNKHLLLFLGNFNAKTGSGHHNYPENIGKYGKGHINSNGENLLDYAKENSLVLTNTLFPHKLAHRTTWTCSERIQPHNSSTDGTPHRNPYRNQIDYIITKQIHQKLITDSRSYSGISTSTDHKLVKAQIKLQWWKMSKQRTKTERIDVEKFKELGIIESYKSALNVTLDSATTDDADPKHAWTRIGKICIETGISTLGKKTTSRRILSTPEIMNLSKKQKKLKHDMDSSRNKAKRLALCKERNRALKKIKKLLKEEENKRLDYQLQEIERFKDDSNKYYQAVRKWKARKPKNPLQIYDEKFNLVTAEDERCQIISKYFKQLFSSDDTSEIILLWIHLSHKRG